MRHEPEPVEPLPNRRGSPRGGFVGDATFEGDLAEFLPALRLGELVHVGKGTTFGLGKYRLEG
jgi:CRISPR/Cas system endoribonuclease Cas6 (RAMP superfamily)